MNVEETQLDIRNVEREPNKLESICREKVEVVS